MANIYVFFIFILFTQQKYIIKRFIGFGDVYPENDDSFVKVVPVDNPYLGVFEQAQAACELLAEELYNIKKNGDFWVFIGYSQGGLVARHTFNICSNIRKYVKRIITLGTPNLGLDQLSVFFQKQQEETKLDERQQEELIQKYGKVPEVVQNTNGFSIFSGFLNRISSAVSNRVFREDQCPKVYLNEVGKIPDLMLQLNMNGLNNAQINAIKQNYLNLDFFMALGFSQDNVISPLDSALFGSNIRLIESIDQDEYEIKKNTFQQVKFLPFNIEREQIEEEIKNEDDQQYIKELNDYLKKKEKKLQKEVQIFKASQKLHVDAFEVQENSQKFIRKYLPFDLPKPPQKKFLQKWENLKELYYNSKELPFFNILGSLYAKKKFILCAVAGAHLKFPDELYFINDEFVDASKIVDILAITDLQDNQFQQFLEILNCTMANYLLIQLTKKTNNSKK